MGPDHHSALNCRSFPTGPSWSSLSHSMVTPVHGSLQQLCSDTRVLSSFPWIPVSAAEAFGHLSPEATAPLQVLVQSRHTPQPQTLQSSPCGHSVAGTIGRGAVWCPPPAAALTAPGSVLRQNRDLLTQEVELKFPENTGQTAVVGVLPSPSHVSCAIQNCSSPPSHNVSTHHGSNPLSPNGDLLSVTLGFQTQAPGLMAVPGKELGQGVHCSGAVIWIVICSSELFSVLEMGP